MRLSFKCPHCRSRSTALKMREITWKSTEVGYRCTNIDCGHTFVAVIEAVRTLSPSSCPRADVDLPLSRHVRRKLLSAQLEHLPEAPGGEISDPPPSTGDLFEASANAP